MRDARDPDGTTAVAEPFLLLRENRLAWTAVERLTGARPAAAGVLTYLYGASGVGKTHLVRQFVREAKRADRTLRVAHVTAAEFAAQLAEASSESTTDQFQQRFRALDLLVCEDLSALEGRWESQRQLVAVIDEILQAGGRVVLTCRKLPGELAGTLPRLVSRCRGGVCAAVAAPDLAGRVSLIGHFAARRQIALPDEAARLLAESLPVSPRELLAAVVQLEAGARAQRAILDAAFIRRFLAGETRTPTPTLASIAQAVARQFEVRVSDLRAANRAQGLVLPRQSAMLLAREQTGESLARIAGYFGRKNHATVVHACRRMKRLLADSPALRQHLTQVRQALGVRGPSV